MIKNLLIAMMIFGMAVSVVGAVPDENGIDYEAYMQQSQDIVQTDEGSWNCVDVAVNYSRHNPEWGFVTISPNANFRGVSHLINYKIVDDEIVFYDAGFKTTALVPIDIALDEVRMDYHDLHPSAFGHEWNNAIYLHFSENESDVVRSYMVLFDNREDFLKYDENVAEIDDVNVSAVNESVSVVNESDVDGEDVEEGQDFVSTVMGLIYSLV